MLPCAHSLAILKVFRRAFAESMRLGKPLIAAAWSGNMEFMTAENSCLVDDRWGQTQVSFMDILQWMYRFASEHEMRSSTDFLRSF